MPRRAPELLNGLARRGAAWMPHVAEGAGSPFRQPRSKARSAGKKRHPGRLFFGYFLLAMQKKVSRLSGRDPTLKHRRDSDTKQDLNAGFRVALPSLHFKNLGD
jgi:hypothetical protein